MKRNFKFMIGIITISCLSSLPVSSSAGDLEGKESSRRVLSRSVAGASEDKPVASRSVSKGPSFLKKLFIFSLLATSGLANATAEDAPKAVLTTAGMLPVSAGAPSAEPMFPMYAVPDHAREEVNHRRACAALALDEERLRTVIEEYQRVQGEEARIRANATATAEELRSAEQQTSRLYVAVGQAETAVIREREATGDCTHP